MPSLEQVRVAEERYTLEHEASLGHAFELLRQRWESGERDRETALRLMFLCWYSMVEPPFLTGLDVREPTAILGETFQSLGGPSTHDPEVLFVVSTMLRLDAWPFGSERHWVSVGKELASRFKALSTSAPTRETFRDRGAYGAYFARALGDVGNREHR